MSKLTDLIENKLAINTRKLETEGVLCSERMNILLAQREIYYEILSMIKEMMRTSK